jgi:hypothetical protein
MEHLLENRLLYCWGCSNCNRQSGVMDVDTVDILHALFTMNDCIHCGGKLVSAGIRCRFSIVWIGNPNGDGAGLENR